MSKMKKIKDLTNVQMESSTKYAKPSREPNDGYFIEKDPRDTFSIKYPSLGSLDGFAYLMLMIYKFT